MVQKLIDETYGKFKDRGRRWTQAARTNSTRTANRSRPNWADYADGRVLSGEGGV